MLVLSRKLNESIIVDGNIRITIVGIRGNHIRVGIEAPDSVPIIRKELLGQTGWTAPAERRIHEGSASVQATA
jgi:carbon storage regulator